MIITGIGSRETPYEILTEMTAIGLWCRKNKIGVYSGHAPGADEAFEVGAQENCTAFLPWKNFNSKFKTKAKLVLLEEISFKRSRASISKFHPAPERLNYTGCLLRERNYFQIVGSSERMTDAVVCWTSYGKASGGTGQALRIAAHYKIPILNMYYPEYNTASKVIKALQKLKV